MIDTAPLYWLLDVESFEYDVGIFRDADLTGKVLIISRQLWSMLRGSTVISGLIGPGIFKGVAESGNRRMDILKPICALLFDPTELRMDEPVPAVDIINPEVIDPLASREEEEIVTVLRQLVLEKGNILAERPVARIKGDTSVPRTIHYREMVQKIKVSHISGVMRARFILGGANGPMYRKLVETFETRGYINPERMEVMSTHERKFNKFLDEDIMSEWMVVERSGFDSSMGADAIRSEYEETLDKIKRNVDSFIYDI
ncbi:MAG: hypothetical protein BAJATHORv1_30218 [Candidatus Thorarchaeota archaeon]|nr:MAG: hypothetical protein BAJATHORv1_30218 [Candidatus Thorarchaeota archaeon]